MTMEFFDFACGLCRVDGGQIKKPRKVRSDKGKRHKKLHDKIVNDCCAWAHKRDALVVPAKKMKVGPNWVSTMPTHWPDIFVVELDYRRRRWLAVEVKVLPDTLSEGQEKMFEQLRARNCTCAAAPPRAMPT